MKVGKHYRFRFLEFWAERGLIMFIDERYPMEDKRSHDVLLVKEFLENIRGINNEVGRIKYADERIEHDKLIENGIACAREAHKQGRPDDPESLRHMLLHRRKSWSVGTGRGAAGTAILHTAPAGSTVEGLRLPPMPRHPESPPPRKGPQPPNRRSIILP